MNSLHVNGSINTAINISKENVSHVQASKSHVINNTSRTRRHGLPFSLPVVAAAFDDRVPSREPQAADRPSMPA